MTFLELCQRVRQECGVSGVGPSAVTDQPEVLKKIVDWTSLAWLTIQQSSEFWTFLLGNSQFSSVESRSNYTPAELGLEAGESVQRLLAVRWEDRPIQIMDWANFLLLPPSVRTDSATPRYATMNPKGEMILAPVPDEALPLEVVWRKNPQKLVSENDLPCVDEQHHMAIVWLAVQLFAEDHEDAVMASKGLREHQNFMDGLYRQYMPPITPGYGAFGDADVGGYYADVRGGF